MFLTDLLENLFKLNICIICQFAKAVHFACCDFCFKILPWITIEKHRCHKCQQVLNNKEQILCTECKFLDGQIFNKVFAVFSYNEPVKTLLLALKLNKKLFYAKFFAKILYAQIVHQWYKGREFPEAIIPMPLHITRLRARGFNQSYELARHLPKTLPVDLTLCARNKPTISQTTLLKPQRKINLEHAFTASKSSYKHLAILDDVITTGATIKSLSKTLKILNPELKLDLWCIARA